MLADISAFLLAEQGEFVIDKTHIEGRVVDDQLRVLDEREELLGHVLEAWFVGEVFVGDAVNRNRAFVDLAIRLQVDMEMPAGQTSPHQLHAADLDDAMAVGDRHAGGFGIQHDTTHVSGS